MTPERNVELVRKMYDLINTKQLAEMAQYISPGLQRHDLVGAYPEVAGSEAMDFLGRLLRGAPDLHGRIEDVFGAEDKVTARVVMEGTHEGDLFGQPGSGKQFAVNMINIYRFDDAKVAESWQLVDFAGFLRQIGADGKPA